MKTKYEARITSWKNGKTISRTIAVQHQETWGGVFCRNIADYYAALDNAVVVAVAIYEKKSGLLVAASSYTNKDIVVEAHEMKKTQPQRNRKPKSNKKGETK